MKDLLEAIFAQLNAGKNAMLATIVERRGSAPRGAGTAMVVSPDGEQTGTVGGGSLEFRVRQDATELLRENNSAMREYAIHTDEKDAYSGGVTVLFRAFSGEAGKLLAQSIRDALFGGENAFLLCELSSDAGWKSCVVDAAEFCARTNQIDVPDHPTLTGNEPKYFIEPLREAARVILFGGGHVAQVMARQLGLLDCRVWVVEDRVEFASEALFPNAERVIHSNYEQAEDMLQITNRDSVIVMSRGHETDYRILRWVLRSKADYIGCIGSKKKIALTRERLLQDGLNEAQIDRLHAPIGLSIGAETPAEIAVSVAAEWIQHQSKKEP